MKKCINCGAELPDEAVFCSYCGSVCQEAQEKASNSEEETSLLEEIGDTSNLLQNEKEIAILNEESLLEKTSLLYEEDNTTVLEDNELSADKELLEKARQSEDDSGFNSFKKFITDKFNELNSSTKMALYFAASVTLIIAILILLFYGIGMEV